MDCLQCGAAYTKKSGTYSLPDPYVGQIILQSVSYYQCDGCAHVLYSAEMARQIESQRNQSTQEILGQFPTRDFVTAAETASILGISRQALHKNRRISHGFIYQTTLGPTTFYLRRSIHQYKRFGDGRFSLRPQIRTLYTEYSEYPAAAAPFTTSAVYEVSTMPKRSLRPLFEQGHLRPKEYSHAT